LRPSLPVECRPWFGVQLGGTLWMLLGAGVLVPVAPGIGLV
jgi:hypothetical protein